ncbi:MAG TPA: hypothetical protein VIF12_08515 [Micavibrio sp.]
MHAILRFALFGAAIFMSACTLDRSVLSSSSGTSWDVKPAFFCPADPVTVSWDFSHMPKNHDNCRPPNGGYGALMSCSFSSMCPMDGACIDSHCCRNDLLSTNECDDGNGCYPDFNITINADTIALSPPVERESRSVIGQRSVSPPDTTIFTIDALYNPPLRLLGESKSATMVRVSPPTRPRITFPFSCQGSPGWPVHDFNREPLATEHARIAGVQNVTGHTVIVGVNDPMRGPVTLRPGETTSVLNGSVQGVWSIRLSPTDPSMLIIPRCESTNIRDPWPDLQLDLLLECTAE